MRALAALGLLWGASAGEAATVSRAAYGTAKDGRPVEQVTLANERGMTVKLINYGGIVTDVIVPDRDGRRDNVVLGFARLADYQAKNGDYAFGAIVGRYAGRIAGARFVVDGREVRLSPNDGSNALHGGPGSFDAKLWRLGTFRRRKVVGAVLHYSSPDGEQGFRGRLDVSVTYSLLPDNALRIDYAAEASRPTVVNLTNHSYFNLAGSGTVRNHQLQILSDRLLETDGGGIPTGRMLPVNGPPFDLREPRTIGAMLDTSHPQMQGRRGFNHSWILANDGRLAVAARLSEPRSGRVMEVLTTEPSIHAYTANWFSGRDAGAAGHILRPHDGVALETQHLPDSPNRPSFPSTLLRPGQKFRSTTVYRFGSRSE